MNRTMITAANTLNQLQKQMDVISNNISNVETTGFKRREATFTDLLVQQLNNQPVEKDEIARLTPYGIRQGSGAKLGQIQMVLTQGALKQSNRQLDTAFTSVGQLYRVLVQNQDGTNEIQYTRDGAFYLSPSPTNPNENMLVTSSGQAILDENNEPITISSKAKSYTITKEGSLLVVTNDGKQQPPVNLGVSLVTKPQFLENKGNNLLGLPENMADLNVTEADILTELNGQRRNQISISQGYLEQSNVDLSKEMTDLITVQRSYQFQTRSINMADQMQGLINGLR